MAHNEAATLEVALRALLSQQVDSATITAFVVVSSGSTDDTDAIVRRIARSESRVHLVTQSAREGKISADNLFFERYPTPLHLLCNADVILQPGALEHLLAPLSSDAVGMTGIRVVPRVRPIDDRDTDFFDFANRLLWAVHHRLELHTPKMGEAVAFRRIAERIPEAAIADEAWLEARTLEAGLEVMYVPEALGSAGCPTTLSDYFAVRRRNYCAHREIERLTDHRVATLSGWILVRATSEALKAALAERLRGRGHVERIRVAMRAPRWLSWLIATVALEVAARGAGALDSRRSPETHRRWHIAGSARGQTGRMRLPRAVPSDPPT